MTELQTLLTRFAQRGTRLTLERTQVQLPDAAGLVPFDRFWLQGPVSVHDWEDLKRLKPLVVAELARLGRFEMSVGDTQEPDDSPAISLVMPTSVAAIAVIQRGRTWRTESQRKNREKRKARKTAQSDEKAPEMAKESSPPKKALESVSASPGATFKLASGRIWRST